MTGYHRIVKFFRILFRLLNGKSVLTGLEHIPVDRPVILAGTHRSLLDPILLAVELYPRPIVFMAKQELFERKWMANILNKVMAIPVNRDKPSQKAIKQAVKAMNEDQHIFGIFPSGTRYSTELKSGTAFIQRLSKRDIIPVAIQPPTIGQFLLRKKAKIAFGPAIAYDEKLAYSKEDLAMIDQKLAEAFDDLDQKLDPNYHYVVPVKKEK